MSTSTIIDRYKKTVIQIATPYSTGTGFFLAEHGLIITNEHVVRDNRNVVIDGETIDKQLANVVYLDEKHDLAFLRAPQMQDIPEIRLRESDDPVTEGDEIVAIGHPFGLTFSVTKGIISNTVHNIAGIAYLQHDAALNPGNSGGPLISSNGEIIGVNTFIIKDGNSIGFSLPNRYLNEAIAEFQKGDGRSCVRCDACSSMVFENESTIKYCTHCGSEISMISQIDQYEAAGINRSIEQMISSMGYDIDLSRMGPNHWSIRRGSAKINIAYHEKSGLIIGDAYLATLPDDNIKELYTFLLKQNYKLEGLTFSVKGQDIILSLLIYDQYLNNETAQRLFNHLLQNADDYDDILVDQFGAEWKKSNPKWDHH